MDAQMMSYGEQFGVMNNQIGNFDDQLVWMEMNQEKLIQDFSTAYFIPLKG